MPAIPLRFAFDRFLIRCLCRAVRTLQQLFGLFDASHHAKPDQPRRILLIKLSGLGALICATSAMRAIRERYPDAELILLTQPQLSGLYEGTDLVNRIDTINLTSAFGILRSFLSWRMRTRKSGKIDLTISFDSPECLSWLLTCLSGGRATIAFTADERPASGITVPVAPDLRHHVRKAYQDLALAVDASYHDLMPVAPRVRASEQDTVNRLLKNWDIHPETLLIGINMNAGEFALHRAWAPQKFILLAQQLEELGEYRVVFLGSRDEESHVARYTKQMPLPAANLAGQTSVRQLAAVIQRLHLLITNDSGMVHLASALDVPTVSIYGPESPVRFGPPQSEEHAVVWQNPSCGPCVSFLAGTVCSCAHGFKCLQDITLDEVRRVVNDMLNHLSDPVDPPWLENQSPPA